jgi:2-polyprenyl-3-methyl-5-hydroxy-6-metoxy-1,4-benzoquinol methylase
VATEKAHGEEPLTRLDRVGTWLSTRSVRRNAELRGKRIADLGCGYDAPVTRPFLDQVREAVLVDVALDDDVKRHPRVRPVMGLLPGALEGLESESFDVILALAILEHLLEPETALEEIYRLLSPNGVVVINVPNWRGKPVLEFFAFRLGISAEGMDDHKCYYDPRDLWPMLVAAGFAPSAIRCRRHKFGFATLAVARKGVDADPPDSSR